ncbi:hypothetical protein B0T18DRAFT_325095 [Schizothecium vesticola]|uniref:Azaphilone pigments biosynthesis cluster protein L N-terminal domain-containing protein n=1 Tax=Schizothecium vesticola TaxID=314040 RepID=A0AA40EWW5_9PEZI|nr:hypothetical protein B0T18DRAFT_325095 [Schizothecium vesticola]
MEPFSITAGVVGIVAPTLHYVRLLVKDLQNIADAPDAVKALTTDLQSVGLALASVHAVTGPQWESLGDAVTVQSKATITTCKTSCERFKTSLDRWTRHSSLQQTQAAEEIKTMISTKETAVNDTIAATNDLSAEISAQLEALTLAEPDEGETNADQTNATKQVAMEKKALGESRKVFEGLLSAIQTVAANAQVGHGPTVTFGSHNQGQQVGVNSGTISATFAGRG